MRHVKGEDNDPDADVLSRMQTNALMSDSPPVIDFRAMAAAQESDPDVLQIRSSSSLTIKATPLAMSDSTILCDTSTGIASPLVPAAFRRAVFKSLHSLSHPCIHATQCLLTSCYAWPCINSDVRQWSSVSPLMNFVQLTAFPLVKSFLLCITMSSLQMFCHLDSHMVSTVGFKSLGFRK